MIHSYYQPKCEVKIECRRKPALARSLQSKPGEWVHCDRKPSCSFKDKGKLVRLCERCAANVRNGAYGERLRDLLIGQEDPANNISD